MCLRRVRELLSSLSLLYLLRPFIGQYSGVLVVQLRFFSSIRVQVLLEFIPCIHSMHTAVLLLVC